MKNYYDILEINANATHADIKKAYRRLVFQHHPDTNQNITDNFKISQIIEAYETLNNPSLRKEYDLKLFYGSAFVNTKINSEQKKDNYKKYGNSSRNPTAGSYKPPVTKNKQVKIPLFETFMYRTLLSFGILGFILSIRDLFTKEWDGINSLTGFFFSFTFTGLLIFSWKNYKKNDDDE